MLSSLVILLLIKFSTRCELINDPTLKPSSDFSAKNDGDAISSQNKKTIARIIFHRTYDERKQIEEYYNKTITPVFEKPLMQVMKDSSVFALNDLYGMVLEPAEEILANSLNANIKNTDSPEVGAIEEIACANDKQMKDKINEKYQTMFGRTVKNDLTRILPENKIYQDALIKLCWEGLRQSEKITPQDVDKEAQALHDINPKKHKEDFKNKLFQLFDAHSEQDLKKIFQKYRKGDHGIDKAVNKAFENHEERRVYNYLVRAIEDHCQLYAYQLRHAADDSTNIHTDKINRIILSRCERDLACIARAYHDKGYKTFTSRLSNKEGHHQEFLIEYVEDPLYVDCIRYLMGKP